MIVIAIVTARTVTMTGIGIGMIETIAVRATATETVDRRPPVAILRDAVMTTGAMGDAMIRTAETGLTVPMTETGETTALGHGSEMRTTARKRAIWKQIASADSLR